jgi:hypothetical protein
MNRIAAIVWGAAALLFAYISLIVAGGPKAAVSGWAVALGFAIAAAYCLWQGWREWKGLAEASASGLKSFDDVKPPPTPLSDFPGAWRGDPIPLETQIEELKQAGLALARGRTIEELLSSWSREQYESDPYGLILFMYGSEVEEEPWERVFCERGWNFDMECLTQAGDYVHALERILAITGKPELVTSMSDTFRFEAEACEIRYTINGRQRVLAANVDNDWADHEAVTAFARDVETTIGDGRHFWGADNGQAVILFFLTAAEAAKINALRPGTFVRYVAD